MSARIIISLATIILWLFTIVHADPPILGPDKKLSQFDQFFLKATNWQENQAASSEPPAEEGPAIEATWFGATQWMSGVNNGYETFEGSMAKGVDFFGSNILPTQYIPVEIRFDSDSANWSNVQVFRRDNSYNSEGVGTFPGSAWDISDTTNPRRLNLCIVELDDGSGPLPPPNFHWDPDSSAQGKFEYLFVMLSSYDPTGNTYAGVNILRDDPDVLFTWWPRLATGHSYFETEPASIRVKIFVKLDVLAFANDAIIDWIVPGNTPDYVKLYGGESNPPTTVIAELPGTETSYWHSGLTESTYYWYLLKAYDSFDNEIGASKIVRISTSNLASKVSLVGYWNERSQYGDCWGYIDQATGHEYALICSRYQGLSIIDIDTFPQVEVGFVAGSSDLKDVKVYKNYAIIISEFAPIKIVDLTDPTNPQFVTNIAGGRHNCLVDGDYLYVCGGDGTGGLIIYDISNPAIPLVAGSYQPYYYHDLAIHNNILAACAITGQGIDLLDVSDKSAITLLANFNYSGSGAHNAAFSEDGNYIFVGDEVGSAGHWTRVFDISNYDSISMVAEIIVSSQATVHNSYVSQSKLLIAHYTLGVRIWNISNPANPYEEGYFKTLLSGGAGFAGAWNVFPYFPSGRFIVSDMSYGLYVLESPLLPPPPSCCQGTRGDFNGDGSPTPNILDLNYIVNLIFRNGPDISCEDEADINGDGLTGNILDLNFIVNIIFRNGIQPNSCP